MSSKKCNQIEIVSPALNLFIVLHQSKKCSGDEVEKNKSQILATDVNTHVNVSESAQTTETSPIMKRCEKTNIFETLELNNKVEPGHRTEAAKLKSLLNNRTSITVVENILEQPPRTSMRHQDLKMTEI